MSDQDQGTGGGGQRVPALYISHGAPTSLVEDDELKTAVHAFTGARPKPEAVVVVSGSWHAPGPVRVSSSKVHSIVRRFTGAPPKLAGFQYPCPGSPEVAARVLEHLKEGGLEARPDQVRALDPAAWIGMAVAYPDADVPVVPVSLPQDATAAGLLALGRTLAPLRRHGVLLMGVGGPGDDADLRRLERKHAPVEPWAVEFDLWLKDRLEALDVDLLEHYRTEGPGAERAVVESVAVEPMLVVLGARGEGERVHPLYEGVHHGHLSMRTFALE